MHRSDARHAFPPYLMLLTAVVGSCVAYYTTFHLNFFLFDWLEFSEGVNWIFLPSGLRLLLVLVFGAPAAIGIALASIGINYQLNGLEDHLFNIVTGVISGGAPLLARTLCVDLLKMDTQLEGLTSQSLLKISALFATLSALLHQIWYFWTGHTIDLAASAAVMAIGDWLGSALILATASWTLKLTLLKSDH